MYQLIRGLKLPPDTTKLILDYFGRHNTAELIHKYFKYPLSRLDFSEWSFPKYTFVVWDIFGVYVSELICDIAIDQHGGISHAIEIHSLHPTEHLVWEDAELISCFDADNTIHDNSFILAKEELRLSLLTGETNWNILSSQEKFSYVLGELRDDVLDKSYFEGIDEFICLDTTLFA